jgi:segregation and condensation protein A
LTVSESTYHIHLPQFEGPFDLLLFFIERDELDINNIPIASITDDFLAYIRDMEALDVDLASEFILMAATLCRIKAKILLPRKQLNEDGEEIDPREELVQRLLEYKRYKSILEDMRRLEEERALREVRGNIAQDLRQIASRAMVDVELEQLTLFRLLKTFERVMRRLEAGENTPVVHTIIRYNYTIASQQDFILSTLEPGKQTAFESIFGQLENRIHAVVTFLALLELLNLQLLTLLQGEGANNFWLALPAEDSVAATSAQEEE